MSAPGGPKREYLRSQHEGSPLSALRWRLFTKSTCVAICAALANSTALAGPVLVYRDECPKERPAGSPRITAEQAIEIAKKLLPRDFCGPNWWVSGCTYDPEWAYDTWRVFAQQYTLSGGVQDIRGRDHSYIVLDAIGNCIANIPGT